MRRRLLILLITAVVVAFACPSSASAHASLVQISPAEGSVVDEPPSQVELTFSSAVEVAPDGVEVFDSSGKRVDVGAPQATSESTVVQTIHSSDRNGRWGVAYRVSSEDGHVIAGRAGFAVGSDAGGTAADRASREAAHVARGLRIGFSVSRFIELIALSILAGGGIFATVVAPGAGARLLGTSLALLAASYFASFVLNGAILQPDGLSSLLRSSTLSAAADTPFARALAVRAALAVAAVGPVLLVRSRRQLPPARRWAFAFVFFASAASLAISGHAVTSPRLGVRLPLDVLHVTAAVIWLGGLVQLALLRSTADSVALSAWARRFGKTAFASVLVLLSTGLYAAYVELDAPNVSELLDGLYGRLVLAKLLLYVATIPLAWNNMTAFVPALERGPGDAPALLRQYVRRELFLLVVVVALTVWLIATPPSA